MKEMCVCVAKENKSNRGFFQSMLCSQSFILYLMSKDKCNSLSPDVNLKRRYQRRGQAVHGHVLIQGT